MKNDKMTAFMWVYVVVGGLWSIASIVTGCIQGNAVGIIIGAVLISSIVVLLLRLNRWIIGAICIILGILYFVPAVIIGGQTLDEYCSNNPRTCNVIPTLFETNESWEQRQKDRLDEVKNDMTRTTIFSVVLAITFMLSGLYFMVSDSSKTYFSHKGAIFRSQPKKKISSRKNGDDSAMRIKSHSETKYVCDACDNEVKRSEKYCSACGNKLDWPD